MSAKYIWAVATFVLFGFAEPTSAGDGTWGVPAGDTMKAQGGLQFSWQGYAVCYDFTFRLREDSDGIYPDVEVVEVEIPGELNPDGSTGSAFIISAPAGSFFLGYGLWQQKYPYFKSWNPPGLNVSQKYNSFTFDFVETDGPFAYPNPSTRGVSYFWGLIIQRGEGEGITMRIKMRLRDSRSSDLRQAPSIEELVMGGPTLRIGNDEWKSYLHTTKRSRIYGAPPPDLGVDWHCSNLFTSTFYK